MLVLDDDTSMQKLVSTLLRRAGYRVDVVSSGTQAIEKIGRRYDALLLDVMTPTDGGFTVIRHLRESDPPMLKRVVLLTASPDSVLAASRRTSSASSASRSRPRISSRPSRARSRRSESQSLKWQSRKEAASTPWRLRDVLLL